MYCGSSHARYGGSQFTSDRRFTRGRCAIDRDPSWVTKIKAADDCGELVDGFGPWWIHPHLHRKTQSSPLIFHWRVFVYQVQALR